MISDSLHQASDLILPRRVGGIAGLVLSIAALLLFKQLPLFQWIIFGLLGTLLGILYAVCQQPASTRGLIGTGIFYGFIVWVVSGFFVGHTQHWLVACLLYGMGLSLIALFVARRAPTQERTVPKD